HQLLLPENQEQNERIVEPYRAIYALYGAARHTTKFHVEQTISGSVERPDFKSVLTASPESHFQ
ncbi:MAG TPA: hypothetical protein QGG18_04420, partial [Rhodospirillales bacterium]|nr:hypothetical protein [Rhodospirillales bacterium]